MEKGVVAQPINGGGFNNNNYAFGALAAELIRGLIKPGIISESVLVRWLIGPTERIIVHNIK